MTMAECDTIDVRKYVIRLLQNSMISDYISIQISDTYYLYSYFKCTQGTCPIKGIDGTVHAGL